LAKVKLRIDHKFFYRTLIRSARSIAGVHPIVKSPFGRMLTTIRDNAQCARFIGTNARFYQLIVFAVGRWFCRPRWWPVRNLQPRRPGFCNWPRSAKVLKMTMVGGVHDF
jgi:hypothetical protein